MVEPGLAVSWITGWIGVEVAVALTVAVAVAVSLGLLSDCTSMVTVPWPVAVRSVWSRIAPVDRPGRMNSGIDCVGLPSSPVRLAVTGPVVPVMAAE